MPMNVAFDECGYTGEHLLDGEQSVFALGSCHLAEDEAKDLLNRFSGRIQGECKYSKLKKAKRNWSLILDLLKDTRLNSSTCKIYVIHKPFMVVSKLVDNIFEPLMREKGIDLYKGKAALATANLIVNTFPVSLGKTRYIRLLSLFSECGRHKDKPTFDRFASECLKVYKHLANRHRDDARIFTPVVEACRRGWTFIRERIPELDHDPTIPAYYTLADEWSKELSERFDIIADESKTLSQERERLLKFSDPDLKDVEVAYYDRSAVYPLKINTIACVDSATSSLIQMADFVVGAACHAFNGKAISGAFDDFEKQLADLLFQQHLIVGGMWPGTDVTPEGLEATGEYTQNPVDYATRILRDDPGVRIP